MKLGPMALFALCAHVSLEAVAMVPHSPQTTPQPPRNTRPTLSDDREPRDEMNWERGVALTDEFLVQSLMEAGVDGGRADRVRLLLLEVRRKSREDRRKARPGDPKYGMQWIGDRAAARSQRLKKKLATVLTAEELRVMEEGRDAAHLEAVTFLLRREATSPR